MDQMQQEQQASPEQYSQDHRGTLIDVLRRLLNRELTVLCAGALAAAPAKELDTDALRTEVEVAFELNGTSDEIIDETLNLWKESVTKGDLTEEGTPDLGNNEHRELLRYYLETKNLFSSSPRKFLQSQEVIIQLDNEPWRFDFPEKGHKRVTLVPGPPTPRNKSDETTTNEDSSDVKSALNPGTAPPIIAKSPSKKKRSRKKKNVAEKNEPILIIVTENMISVAQIARQIASERAKMEKLGRVASSPTEGIERPGDLPLNVLREVGLVFRDLYETLIPPLSAEREREDLRRRFQGMMDEEYRFPEVTVTFFGSCINNLGFASSDVDIILEVDHKKRSPKQMAHYTSMYRLAATLRRWGMLEVFAIAGARVPICKFYDPESKLHCDMNFGNVLGKHNSRLLRTYTQIDPRVRPLIMLVKHWAKNRDVNDSADGGTISSYAYSLMVLNYLQIRGIIPSLQEICSDRDPMRLVISRQSATKRFHGRQAAKQDGRTNVVRAAPINWERQGVVVNVEDLIAIGKRDGLLTPAILRDDELTAAVLEQLVLAQYGAVDQTPSQTEDKANRKDKEKAGNDKKAAKNVPRTILLADINFVDDMSHPRLGSFVSRGAALTEDEVWMGREGVASLFFDFLRYYAWDFYFRANHIVSVRKGGILTKVTPELEEWGSKTGMMLVVEDPFQLDRNTTGGVKHPALVVKEMRRGLKVLGKCLNGRSAGAAVEELMQETLYVRRKRLDAHALDKKAKLASTPNAGHGPASRQSVQSNVKGRGKLTQSELLQGLAANKYTGVALAGRPEASSLAQRKEVATKLHSWQDGEKKVQVRSAHVAPQSGDVRAKRQPSHQQLNYGTGSQGQLGGLANLNHPNHLGGTRGRGRGDGHGGYHVNTFVVPHAEANVVLATPRTGIDKVVPGNTPLRADRTVAAVSSSASLHRGDMSHEPGPQKRFEMSTALGKPATESALHPSLAPPFEGIKKWDDHDELAEKKMDGLMAGSLTQSSPSTGAIGGSTNNRTIKKGSSKMSIGKKQSTAAFKEPLTTLGDGKRKKEKNNEQQHSQVEVAASTHDARLSMRSAKQLNERQHPQAAVTASSHAQPNAEKPVLVEMSKSARRRASKKHLKAATKGSLISLQASGAPSQRAVGAPQNMPAAHGAKDKTVELPVGAVFKEDTQRIHAFIEKKKVGATDELLTAPATPTESGLKGANGSAKQRGPQHQQPRPKKQPKGVAAAQYPPTAP
ncbi:hypothetical protein DFJ77DRAFT_511760 [Powellomyces hirtus]|nr:hypothetical protein DFJ77DRAFT_511760 [Powellomyces hirtus]